MALQLDTLHKGIIADYWKITSIHPDLDNNMTYVHVSLFVNSLIRADGMQNALEIHAFAIEGIDLTRVQLYAALKLEPLFEGAIDV